MKIKNLTILSVALATLFACNKPQDEPAFPNQADYKGTVTVEATSGSFDNEDIRVNFEASEDGTTATLTIYQIRFVPTMPVTIDVTIPNVQLSQNGSVLSCEQVVPLAMGGEFPRYTVTNLTGKREGNELSFSLNFGSTPTSFKGVLTVFEQD